VSLNPDLLSTALSPALVSRLFPLFLTYCYYP
jgi:hypothetical protein